MASRAPAFSRHAPAPGAYLFFLRLFFGGPVGTVVEVLMVGSIGILTLVLTLRFPALVRLVDQFIFVRTFPSRARDGVTILPPQSRSEETVPSAARA